MTTEARSILENIIENFEPEKFVLFFRRKSPQFAPAKENLQQYNDEYFADTRKLGEIKFTDSDRLIVCTLSAKKALTERSGKIAQYRKAKKILTEKRIYVAGIFLFYDKDGNFRFSLVYPEHAGAKKEWSNFRRFTYFVSADPEVTNKTFKQRIGDGDFSTLEKIKEAFAVGPVTELFYKEFFEEYEKLVQAVRKINKIDEEKARDFVLLFAIRTIFLGFIQKRRWLDNNEKFIQSFFQAYQKSGAGNKFYEDWLTIVFFEALNYKFTPRKHLPKEINNALMLAPFLNGGLFKSKPEYDDQGWIIPDKEIESFFTFLFAHSFTIEESSINDAELQLNPEFLGIIFERLVNKADGAVYTPRTEVDLMCRLSLVKWLMKNLTLPIAPVNLYELFFREGVAEEDQKDGSFSTKEAKEILSMLENLALCDPGVGSGAFLVGMMQVLDEIEEKLRDKAHLPSADIFERKKQIISQSLYGVEVKAWAVWICQLRLWLSLFVDAPEDMRRSTTAILPSLDFKVRQGDSLVQRIGNKTFPVTGHAVISDSVKKKVTQLKNLKTEYFYNKTSTQEWAIKHRELAIYDEIISTEIREKSDYLNALKGSKPHEQSSFDILDTSPRQTRIELDKEKIEKLTREIEELKEQKTSIRKDKPLIWNIEFAEIFVEKEGFDIIIGNPPYVKQEEIADPLGRIKDKKDYKDYLQEMVRVDFDDYFTAKKKINAQSDLYTYFYIRALRLLNSRGIHTFICSNSWLDVGYGVWLQDFLLNRCPVELIIDNHAKRSFEAADINTIISVIHAPQKKIDPQHPVKFVAFKKPFEEAIFTENLLAIEDADKVIANDIFRVYPITIKELIAVGTEYESDSFKKSEVGKYEGDKWGGKYLRAPDIFFTILSRGQDKLIKLSKMARVIPGCYSGINDFFYLDKERAKKLSIERDYLLPIIRSSNDIDCMEISFKEANYVLSIPSVSKNELAKHAHEYVLWGEKQKTRKRQKTQEGVPWPKVETVKARKYWYSIPENNVVMAKLFMQYVSNSRFYCPYSKKQIVSDRCFHRILPKEADITPKLSLTLNSSLQMLFVMLYGRYGLGQGALKFEASDANKVLIVNPCLIDIRENQLENILDKIGSRKPLPVFDECGIDPESKKPIEEQEPKPLPDRAELDKIVFDALGLTKEERKEVYRAICRLVWNRISKAKSV